MTLTQARKTTQRFLQPINDVEPQTQHSEKTLNDLISRWRVAVKPNLRRSTQFQYDDWAIKKWIGPWFGPWTVAEITKADIQSFLTAASRNLAGKSVRNLRVVLRSLLSVAVEWEWIFSNPAAGRLRLPEALPARPKRILTPTQVWELVDALSQPYRTIVTLAVLSGLRKGEISGLRWNDVLGAELIVDESVYRGHIGPPKTTRSRRQVAIGPLVQEALGEWRSQARFTETDDFVFSVRTASPIDLHNAIARHIKPACRKLGLPEVSWHDLRHVFTTWGRKAGIEAETLRDQLGHASVQMTLDVYSHAQDRGSAAARIEEYAARKVA